MRPVFEVVESPGGLYIGAQRNAENGNYYWRITQWVIPTFTMIPPRGDHSIHGHFWIPIDDETCWTPTITSMTCSPHCGPDPELVCVSDQKLDGE